MFQILPIGPILTHDRTLKICGEKNSTKQAQPGNFIRTSSLLNSHTQSLKEAYFFIHLVNKS